MKKPPKLPRLCLLSHDGSPVAPMVDVRIVVNRAAFPPSLTRPQIDQIIDKITDAADLFLQSAAEIEQEVRRC